MSLGKLSSGDLYMVAQRVISKSGIKANLHDALHPTPYSYLTFDLEEPYKMSSNGIHFSIRDEEDHIKIEYFRLVADSEEELIKKADFLKTLTTIVQSQRHELGYEDFGSEKRPEKTVRITAQVKAGEVDKFAEFIETIDRVMLLYLHPSYKRSTKK